MVNKKKKEKNIYHSSLSLLLIVYVSNCLIYASLSRSVRILPYACAAGAIGGGLADLLTAPVWAPATIIIKMLICLPFSSKGTKLVTKRNVVALFLAFAISATGYYIAEGIIYGNWIAPAASIPGNLVQIGVAAVLVLPIAEVVRRAIRR